MRSAGKIPNAVAISLRVSRVTFRSPRSIAPIYVLWRPHFSAISSCDQPCASLMNRRLCARVTLGCCRGMAARVCFKCRLYIYRLDIAGSAVAGRDGSHGALYRGGYFCRMRGKADRIRCCGILPRGGGRPRRGTWMRVEMLRRSWSDRLGITAR